MAGGSMEHPIVWNLYFYGLIILVPVFMVIAFGIMGAITRKAKNPFKKTSLKQMKYAWLAYFVFVALHFLAISEYGPSYMPSFLQIHGFWVAAVVAIFASGLAPFAGSKE